MEDGSHNCTRVCTDSQLLYRQPYLNGTTLQGNLNATNATTMEADILVPYNIYNCMIYPYISALLTNHDVPETYRQTARILADHYDIQPNISSTLLQTIRSTQWDCVQAFCMQTNAQCAFAVNESFVSDPTQSQNGPGFSQVWEQNDPNTSSKN